MCRAARGSLARGGSASRHKKVAWACGRARACALQLRILAPFVRPRQGQMSCYDWCAGLFVWLLDRGQGSALWVQAGYRLAFFSYNCCLFTLSSHLSTAQMDTLGFEPRAFRMRSGCDATTPCAPWNQSAPHLPSALMHAVPIHVIRICAKLLSTRLRLMC